MINKNYTRDQLKEILEDELFQNLLFHTADCCCHNSFTRYNKYEKSKLEEKDFKSIDRSIKFYPLNDNSKLSNYFYFVALYFLKDDIDNSINHLEQFLELYDKPVENNIKKVLTEYAFSAAGDINRYEESGHKISKCRYLVLTKQYQKVIPLLEELLNNPDECIEKTTEGAALHLMACCYFELNQFDEAMTYFNIFLSRFPDYLDIHALLGNYYQKVCEYEKAIESYNIEKEFFNNRPNPFKDNIRTTYDYKCFIGCYSKIGKIDELIQHFEELLSIKPDNEVLWTYLAMCYQTKKVYDNAFEMVDKALSINSFYSEALKVLGVNYYHQEGYNRAIYYFKESIKVKYDDFNSNYYLGYTYIKTKDYDKAIRIFQFILSIWPNCGPSYFALGSLYKNLGKEDLALECFEKASKLKPFDIDEYNKIDFE